MFKPIGLTKEDLRSLVVDSLVSQGFYVNGHVIPSMLNKEHFRSVQLHSKNEQIELQKNFLRRSLPKVKKYFLNGWDLNPNEIQLEIRPVERNSIEETIFRWWNLVWWSVPYQKAYGRQLRFILWDKTHNAPFGIIGLQSPILRMAVRDRFLKIPRAELDYWVNRSMQAQRLGALPPYNELIGGKMVALAATSNELRESYRNKYENVETLLKGRSLDNDLLFLTTTSAFGRSSIYNRLKFKDEKIAMSLGFTKGSGSFHVPANVYIEIRKFLEENSINTATTFGFGASRKVKLLDKAFGLLGLRNYHYHNIQREYFLFPLVENLEKVIQRKIAPNYFDRPLDELNAYWKSRWALPRFERANGWISFDAENFHTKILNSLNGKK